MFSFSDKTYDLLKKITMVVLPATATLIYAVFETCNLDLAIAGTIVGIISAVETFLATTLGISTATWKAEQK